MITRVIDIAGFAVCGVLLIVLLVESKARDKTAPLGVLLDRLMTARAVRVTVILFWWWIGWHFLVSQPL